jgi:protein TonB
MKYINVLLLLSISTYFLCGQSNGKRTIGVSPDMSKSPIGKELFKVIEDMPRFPGCEHIEGKNERRKCAEDALIEYIDSNLAYPVDALDAGIEGKAYIQFVVNDDGSMSDIELVRDLDGGCGQAALDMANKMKEEIIWISGKQRGVPKNVLFTLPIEFRQ